MNSAQAARERAEHVIPVSRGLLVVLLVSVALLGVLMPCRLRQLLQPVMSHLTEKVHLLELRSEQLRILLSCTGVHLGAFSADVLTRHSRRPALTCTPRAGPGNGNCRLTVLNYSLFDRTGEKCWVQTMVAWTRVQDGIQDDESGRGSPSPWQLPRGTLEIFGWSLPPAGRCRARYHADWLLGTIGCAE